MTIYKTFGALTLALLLSAGVASAQTADASAAVATTMNTSQTGATSVPVSIQSNAFIPHNVIVASGTTVRWTNNDTVQHSIVADNGSFVSGLIPVGGTYSNVFSDTGTYLYYDPTYGGVGGKGMFGIIVVLPAGSTVTPTGTVTPGTSTLPGLPNTGGGGTAAKNIAMLALSALIVVVGTRAFLRAL